MKSKVKISEEQSRANSSEGESIIPAVSKTISRRFFIHAAGMGVAALGLQQIGCSVNKRVADQSPILPPIQGFERTSAGADTDGEWVPLSDRKIRVGIVGYGVCRFGADFGFQNHPNVEVVAVSDLFPERCAELARLCNCSKTYPSLAELVKDDNVEAVFIATDAASHFEHAIAALSHGRHVAAAVPAVFGSLEDADRLYEAVKTSGLTYMMFETSCYREDLYAMRKIHEAGAFGKSIYSEGEYYHYMSEPIDSYKGWRIGLPPQWYPTHSNAYYTGVTGGSFTEVSCMGMPSIIEHLKAENNRYKNPFGTEIALFRTDNGGTSRMAVSWDTPGDHGERGRFRGEKGSFYGRYEGLENNLPDLLRKPLPPGMPAGGHGGSHGHLTDEFVSAILQNRKPLVDISMALNLTVPGIVAHESAMKNGELMKIPQY